MAAYAGRRAAVYMSTTGSGTATAITGFSAWTINQTQANIEVTAFLDANKTYVAGIKDLQGTFAGFWKNESTVLFSGADSSDGVKLYTYPTIDIATSYFYGPAWVDATMNVGVNDAVKVDGKFVANGSWGRYGI